MRSAASSVRRSALSSWALALVFSVLALSLTLAALDAMVIARTPFIPGCVVRSRPIGVLHLEDEHGGDEKLVCVPVDTTFPYYADVGERSDLPSIVLAQIEHFFKHYKDLESEKWVRIGQWGDAEEAKRIVIEAIAAAKAAKKAKKAKKG